MFRDDHLYLICPFCKTRFVLSPQEEEAIVPCPNPSCAKPIDLSLQLQEEDDDYSRRLSRKIWFWIACLLVVLALTFLLRACD